MRGNRGWMAMGRRGVFNAFVVVVAVVLVAFAIWCTRLMREVSVLRDDVSTRVGWLQQLHAMQQQGQAMPTDPVGNAAIEAELDVLVREVMEDPKTTVELRSAAQESLRRDHEPLFRVSRLVTPIRAETSRISVELSERWDAINWLAAIAIALAASTLGLLVYVRFVLLRRAQHELTGLQAHLRDADRMAAVGTLAAGVAHELSNPLTYVVGNLRLLQRSAQLEGEPRVLTDEALQGVERIMGIVRDLRSVAQPSRDDIASCDVNACIEAALTISRSERRHVTSVVRELGEVPNVWGSEARLGQLFLNLVINAAHALVDRDAAELRVTSRPHGSAMVEIEVGDNGPGIRPDLVDHVFEPFVTSKPIGEGTGLGLFVCHNIVRSLDGEIDVKTSREGTVVRVRLPAARLHDTAPSQTAVA